MLALTYAYTTHSLLAYFAYRSCDMLRAGCNNTARSISWP